MSDYEIKALRAELSSTQHSLYSLQSVVEQLAAAINQHVPGLVDAVERLAAQEEARTLSRGKR